MKLLVCLNMFSSSDEERDNISSVICSLKKEGLVTGDNFMQVNFSNFSVLE